MLINCTTINNNSTIRVEGLGWLKLHCYLISYNYYILLITIDFFLILIT